jgi:chromosome segregation ATPase
MAADEKSESGRDERVEELLRVNAELAAEIRSMVLGRTDVPRSAMLGASRRLVKITEERDGAEAELAQQNASLVELSEEVHQLRRRIEIQNGELERLRAGPSGIFRRAKASLLRRRSTRGGGA